MQWVLGHYLCSSSIAKMRPSCTGSYMGLGKSGVLSDSAAMMDPRTLSRKDIRSGPMFPSQPCPWTATTSSPWPSSLATQPLFTSPGKDAPCTWPVISIHRPMGNSNDLGRCYVRMGRLTWTTPHILKVAPIWSRWKERVSLGFITLAQLST